MSYKFIMLSIFTSASALPQLDDEDSILPHKLQAALEHVLDRRKELACEKGDIPSGESAHALYFFLQNIALQHSSCTLKDIRAFLENWLHKVCNCEKLWLFLVYCRFLFHINIQNMGRTLSGGSGMCTIVYVSECLWPFCFSAVFFSNQNAAPSARSSPRLLCAFSWR